MSTQKIGWNVDSLNKVSTGYTGTNFVLGRLAALNLVAETDRRDIDPVEFQTVMAHLAYKIANVTPEEFYGGGAVGSYLGPIITALGATATTLPATPSFVTASITSAAVSADVATAVSTTITTGAVVSSIAWTVVSGTSAVITGATDEADAVFTADSATTGATVFRVTYTYDSAATATADITITVS